MPTREATMRYREIIRGLLAQPIAHSAGAGKPDPWDKHNARCGARHRLAGGAPLPAESRNVDTASVTLDTLAHNGRRRAEQTATEAGPHDRAMLRPARGIVFSIILGVALWALVIVGILLEVIR